MPDALDNLSDSVLAATDRIEAAVARRHDLLRALEPEPGDNGRIAQSVDQFISIWRASQQGQQLGASTPLTPAEARAAFRRWQYAAITAIAEAVMMTPWAVETRDADGWSADEGHPLHALLTNANDFTTGPELIYWTVVELQLEGRSFWQIVDNELGEPGELWPMLGTISPIVKKRPGAGSLLTGWKQVIWAKGVRMEQELPRREVVYLRLPKPGDMFGGYGPLQATAPATKLDDQRAESQWQAFKYGLFPGALLKFSENDPKKRDQIVAEFQDRYEGVQKTGKAMATGPGIELTFPQTSPREMGYHTGAKDLRDEILGTLRVPEAILGLSATVNKASVAGMEYIFAKWRISPLLALLDARVDQDLAKAHWGDDVRVRHESPVPIDREFARQKRQTDMATGIMSMDEGREEDGKEPWPNRLGELPYLSMGLLPIGSPPPAAAPGEQGAQQRVEVQARRSRGLGKRKRREVYARYVTDRLALERRLAKVYRKEFKAIGHEIVDAWGGAKEEFKGVTDRRPTPGMASRIMLQVTEHLEDVLDTEALAARLAKTAATVNRAGIILGGAFDKAVLDSNKPWKSDMDIIDRYLAEYGPAHYAGVADRTRDAYMAIVRDGVAEGLSWDELRLKIAHEASVQSESRVANIATTETTKLYGSGAQGFRDTYEVPGKQWLTSHVNSRETHVAMDGVVVRNGEYFQVGADSMLFPGDGSLAEENCNCNCVVVGTFDVE